MAAATNANAIHEVEHEANKRGIYTEECYCLIQCGQNTEQNQNNNRKIIYMLPLL
jgi:hypothetical protein